MVGIEPPGLDRVPEGPGRDLVLALHGLYRGSGKPSTRRIAEDVLNGDYRDTVSHETVAAMLRGDRGLPRWEKLEAVVSVLALRHTPPLDPVAEATRMQALWHAAQGHTNLDETARDLARTPAATPPASGVIEAPADPAGPVQSELSEPLPASGVLGWRCLWAPLPGICSPSGRRTLALGHGTPLFFQSARASSAPQN